MNNSISQKEIAYFLDRALPIAKMDVMRCDKDLPPIFIEGGDATSEMQEYLRKALKILASKAKNYGVDKGNLKPVKAISEKSYKSDYSDLEQYYAWQRARILWCEWYDKDRMRRNDPLIYDILFNGDGHADEYEGAVAQARAHYWCDDEKQFRAPRYKPSEIYGDYLEWCEENGLTPWKSGTFLKRWKMDALDNGSVFKKTGADGRHWRYFDFVNGWPKKPKAL